MSNLRVNQAELLKAAKEDMNGTMNDLIDDLIQGLNPYGDDFMEDPDIPEGWSENLEKEVNRLRNSIPEYSEKNVLGFLKEVKKIYKKFKIEDAGPVVWMSF